MKLFIGNLGDAGEVTSTDLRPMFEQYGTVSECEVIKNYAFVHMPDEAAAQKAVDELHNSNLKGRAIKVEKSESKGPRKPSQKLFVGNIAEGTTSDEIKTLFERFATVMEADVIKNYGFVHIDQDTTQSKVNEIIRELNGYSINGSNIRVQHSTSGLRQKPGMGGGENCYSPYGPKGAPSRGGGGYGSGAYGGSGGPMRGGRTGGNERGYSGGDRGYGAAGGRDYNSGGGRDYSSGGRGDCARSSDPYPPPPQPRYMNDSRGSYDEYNRAGGAAGYGSRSAAAAATDPYRSSAAGYDSRTGGGGASDPYRASSGAAATDMYARRDAAASAAYGSAPPMDSRGAPPPMRDPYTGRDPYSGYATSAAAPPYGTAAAGYASTSTGYAAAQATQGSDMYSRNAGTPSYSAVPATRGYSQPAFSTSGAAYKSTSSGYTTQSQGTDMYARRSPTRGYSAAPATAAAYGQAGYSQQPATGYGYYSK